MSTLANKLYIVMYHYTRDLIHSRYPNIKGLDVELFRKQIEFFKSYFNVIRMEDLIAYKRGESGELPDNAVLLTFDDGYVDNYTYAFPILDDYGLQGSFFVPGKIVSTHELLDVNKVHYVLASADIHELVRDVKDRLEYYRGGEFDLPDTETLWNQYAIANRFDSEETIFVKRVLQTAIPEKLRNIISSEMFDKYMGVTEEQLAYELYMTYDQIKTMKKHGMYIGIHGYDHYWLGNLENHEMRSDISKALEVMDEFIDRNEWVMNYPYGNYNDEVIGYVQTQGACIGLTTEVRVAELRVDNYLTLPRFDCNDFPPKSENYKYSCKH